MTAMPAFGRLAHDLELRHAGVGEDDDDVELLRDQALDVGDLLLGLELAVGVADFRDVRALLAPRPRTRARVIWRQ